MTVARSSCSTRCGTYPTFNPGARAMTPPLVGSSPISMRKIEVLPDPFGPTSPTFWPDDTLKETSSSTATWP